MGCYGLSIQNIIANYIQYTPEPPPHDQPAKLARYVMHYSGKFYLHLYIIYRYQILILTLLYKVSDTIGIIISTLLHT